MSFSFNLVQQLVAIKALLAIVLTNMALEKNIKLNEAASNESSIIFLLGLES